MITITAMWMTWMAIPTSSRVGRLNRRHHGFLASFWDKEFPQSGYPPESALRRSVDTHGSHRPTRLEKEALSLR